MGDDAKLKTKVIALQKNAAAVLQLLGGDDDDRLRFWEIMKGITTPAVFRLIDHEVDGISRPSRSADQPEDARARAKDFRA
jgi:hypothetical protein